MPQKHSKQTKQEIETTENQMTRKETIECHTCRRRGTLDVPLEVEEEEDPQSSASTVSSRGFNLHNFKFGASNPRSIACFHFEVPFEGSNLPGAGPIFPD